MFGLSGCLKAQSNDMYTDTDVAGFANLLKDKNVQLLDVRTPEEYAEGHIRGAKNINVYDRNFIEVAVESLDKSRPVAVYCRSGRRSAEAAELLAKKGYKVTNLEGGYLAWEKAVK